MAEDFDPDKYLESVAKTAPEKSDAKEARTRDRSSHRSKDRSSRSDRHKSHKHRSHSPSKSHRHHSHHRSSSKRHHSHSKSKSASKSPVKSHSRERSRTPEDVIRLRLQDIQADESTRETRTVFVKQLKRKISEEDIRIFFEQVGKVRKATVITDKSGRSRGMAYVEMAKSTDVSAALLLDGTPFCTQHQGCKCSGIPIIVKPSEVEKNYAALAAKPAAPRSRVAPSKIYVSNIHSKLGEEELKDLFKKFGEIDKVELMCDEHQKSKEYAFISFYNKNDAQRAVEKIDGLEIGGRKLKVSLTGGTRANEWTLDDDSFSMNSKMRAELISKISQGKNIDLDAPSSLPDNPFIQKGTEVMGNVSNCILLKNLFNPAEESGSEWPTEILADVNQECAVYGRIFHSELVPDTMGHVYLMFATSAEASRCAEQLNGRWFGKRMITVEYIPEGRYVTLFPTARQAASQAKIVAMNQ